MQPHSPLPAPLQSPLCQPRLYAARSVVSALVHWRPGLARKLGYKESARVENPAPLRETHPERNPGWQACQLERRAFPLPVERAPHAEFPVPLAPALHLRTMQGIASQLQAYLRLGYLSLSLAACRSLDSNWHGEDCPYDRRDRRLPGGISLA